jgi:hypothetical protein
MRWICVFIAVTVSGTSPWLMPGVARAQLGEAESSSIRPVGMTAVRPLEIEGAHGNPIPEPSTAAALGLLGTAFLIRRRRPCIN